MEVIIAFTGHANIEKCWGYEIQGIGETYNQKAYEQVFNDIQKFIFNFCSKNGISFDNLTIVSGMARGVDEIAALVAIANRINLIASIPVSTYWHKNRELSRGIKAQAIWYDYILNYPKITIRNVAKGEHKFVNFARNADMIEISTYVASYKKYDSTGTDHCIREAKKRNKYLGNIPDMIK